MEVLFNFTFNNLEGMLLALIPALLNWGILFYILFYLPKNNICYTFSLFVASLAIWQTSDVFTRISATPQTALLWSGLLGIGVLLIVPAGLHFVLLFIENDIQLRKKITNLPLAIFLLYFPVIFFFSFNIVTTSSSSLMYHPIWGWQHKTPYNNIILLESLWISGLALAIIIILFSYAGKIKQDKEKYFQTLLIAWGFTMPALIGIITKVILPNFFNIPPIPVSSTVMSIFSITTLIALTHFKLFKMSSSIAASTILETIKDIVIIVNPQEKIEFINVKGAEVLGLNYKNVETLNIKDLFPKDCKFYQQFIECVWSKALKGIYTEGFNTVLVKQGTIEIPVSLSVVPIPITINYQTLPSILLVARDITEQNIAEQFLKETEELFKSAFNNAPIGISLVNTEGKYLRVNSSLCTILGYSEKELLEKTFFEITFPDDIDKGKNLLNSLISKEMPAISSEKRYFNKEGHLIWVKINASLYCDTNGKPQYIIAHTENITEQKKSDEKWKTLLEFTEDSILISDFDSAYFIEANPAASKMFGYSSSEFRQLKGRNLHPADVNEAVNEISFNLINFGIAYNPSIKMIRKNGEVFWGSLRCTTYEVGKRKLYVTIIGDITERKKSETQIYEQAELLDKAQDAIIVRDLDYNIIYWNKSAERLYGWTKAEIIGKNVTLQLYKENINELVNVEEGITEKGEWIGELKQSTKSGNEIIVQSRWNLIHDKSGSPKSILSVNTDITEKKRMETQFLRVQRLESIGTLTGGIAHDLNNVLAPIMMSVDILKMKLSDKKRDAILSTLESSVKRGSDIIKQLLIFARGEIEKEHTNVNINQLILNITQIINRTFPKSINLSTSISENLWPVTGDITQLEQILLNLCVNARDAMPDGGKLTICAENIFIDENLARMNITAKVGPYVCIEINDTGTGIPPEIIDKIFEPFFTTKEFGKGTGLGLSSLTGIIKSHQGFINLSSEVGKGTQFKVYLPSEESKKIDQNVDEQSELLRGNGELILIVDDEVNILEIMKNTLETFGYNVLVACNGTEAIKIYKENQNSVKIILTDVSMPVMDGLITTKALQQIDPLVKVIIVSGLTTNKQAAEVSGNNENFFLQKPYTTADLLKKIKDILHNS